MAAYCFASKLLVLSSINVGRKILIFEPLAVSEGRVGLGGCIPNIQQFFAHEEYCLSIAYLIYLMDI